MYQVKEWPKAPPHARQKQNRNGYLLRNLPLLFVAFTLPIQTKTNLISYLLAPRLLTCKKCFYLCRPGKSTKMRTILKIPLPTCSQVFCIDSSYSTKVLVRQHRFVNDDTVHKRILRSNSCLAVSGFALSFLPLSLYVYAPQLHGFLVRCFVAHHGKWCDMRWNRDNGALSWQLCSRQ